MISSKSCGALRVCHLDNMNIELNERYWLLMKHVWMLGFGMDPWLQAPWLQATVKNDIRTKFLEYVQGRSCTTSAFIAVKNCLEFFAARKIGRCSREL